MSNRWGNSQNTSDKMADKLDRKIKDSKKHNKNTYSLQAQIAEANRQKSFDDKYPCFGIWEKKLIENLEKYNYYNGSRNRLPLDDLNQQQGTTGSAAYKWIQSLYEKEVIPSQAAREIMDIVTGKKV